MPSPTAPAAAPSVFRISERLDLRFAVRYAFLAGVLFVIYAFPYELFGAKGDWLDPYLAAYAQLAGHVLGLFEQVTVEGPYIHGRFPLQIVRNCDAADVNILFASALLAFPGPWRAKLAPLLRGLVALVAANVTRICTLYYVGVYAPTRFELAHEEVWPLLLVATAVLVFVLAARELERGAQSRA